MPILRKDSLKIIVITPITTTATSERSFLTLKKVKTSLLSKMVDSRLNHHLMIHLYIEELDEIDIK